LLVCIVDRIEGREAIGSLSVLSCLGF